MALHILTNERDKDGKLVEQLIVTDVEEVYFKKLANQVFSRRLKNEYKMLGLPCGTDEKDEKRARIFRSLVFFHNFGRWLLLTVASGLVLTFARELVNNLEIGFKPHDKT